MERANANGPYLAGAAGDAFTESMAPIVAQYHGGDTVGAVADFYGPPAVPALRRRRPPRRHHLLQMEAPAAVAAALGQFLG